MQDFDFEVMEYFNGDNDNMEPARKFRITFSEDFTKLAVTTSVYETDRDRPLLRHTMLYILTDEKYPGKQKSKNHKIFEFGLKTLKLENPKLEKPKIFLTPKFL